MYSPPAISDGKKYERTSPSTSSGTIPPSSKPYYSQRNSGTHPSAPLQQQHRLPSLPPFPSLVSSLGERSQDFASNSFKSQDTLSASAKDIYRESSTLPPPPFYSQHIQQSSHSRSPSSVESAARSSFESSTNLHETRHESRAHLSTEDHKPEILPLPAGYPTAPPPFRRPSQVHVPRPPTPTDGNMSGNVDWQSSMRTGSTSNSASEAPLSPSHPNAKRRRISAAHDAVHGSASAEDLHDDDDHHHQHGQLDELSPSMAQHHTLMNESASPQAGAGDEDTNGTDEKGANGRTLKQTKRAAQNRAAQQAFRKRKEERIRELEEKEKVLQSLVARENEIMRRERILAERERSLPYVGSSSNNGTGASAGPPSSSGNVPVGSATAAPSNATNDWDRAFASAPVASPIQHIAERLESSNRTNDLLKNEVDALKKQLQDKNALVESLRRSLEDLGAENRSLRDAVGRSSMDARQHQQHQHQQHQHQQQQQHEQHHVRATS